MGNDDLNGDAEEEEVVKALLRDAFGESSSSSSAEDDEDVKNPGGGAALIPNWEKIREIDGLWICKDFLSPDQQSSLLSSINKEGWLNDASSNQAMRFGDLPRWAVELSDSIREAVFFSHGLTESAGVANCDPSEEGSPFPSDLLWREPLFDQLIMNTYEPGEVCSSIPSSIFPESSSVSAPTACFECSVC
ncbi:OLC1v1003707C2 [Oldenlandia corymbosa var. corymbosa]|uniref:OLC1v1003707C2 n=1 Tax=Oldenlandia corymbosa var. corymbosa TaxID=529605 RepID=A0AAV1DAN0_OLDCO|nr:OLC1v1003707C2 [Oldenlandia corymbosa var. corymbosa]